METVYRCIDKIYLKNDNGEFVLNCFDAFDENIDEILIRTAIVYPNLKRGWIGDLTYVTEAGLNPKDMEINSFGARDTFYDVLLANVKIWDTDGCITWEYRFLKK